MTGGVAKPALDARASTALIDCTQALYASYRALDQGDFSEVADGFAPDGVWFRQGRALRGPDEVRAALHARPSGRLSVHLISNVALLSWSADTVTLAYLLIAYSHDRAPGESAPVPAAMPVLIAWQNERMRFDSHGGWRTLERRSQPVFAG